VEVLVVAAIVAGACGEHDYVDLRPQDLTAIQASVPETFLGQASVLLDDGDWLITGGPESAPSDQLTILQPDGKRTAPQRSLRSARTAHSATVLPDGSVLIFGGVGQDGTFIAAESIEPAGFTSEPMANLQGKERRNHTSTLLPDGRVLVVGGRTERGLDAEAFLWNPATKSMETCGQLEHGRERHTAQLLPTGMVLIAGGKTSEGSVTVSAAGIG